MSDEPNLDSLLSVIGGVNDLLAKSPRGAVVFEQLRNQEISIDEAVKVLVQIVREEGLLPDMLEASEKISNISPDYTLSPEVLTQGRRPVMMQTSTGIPQLNPIYEAAIAERSSLDGDVPELRFGPLPEDAFPAVPVDTIAMDPVVVGAMLDDASRFIRARFDDALEDHTVMRKQLLDQAKVQAEARGDDPETAMKLAEEFLPPAPTGVEGYRAGEPASLMKMDVPNMEEIMQLPAEQRREFAFKALATTQGRVSMSQGIHRWVLGHLKRKGCTIEKGLPDPAGSVSAAWSMRAWGPEDIKDGFQFGQIAAGILANKLLDKVDESTFLQRNMALALEVYPYNGIADRQFGWVARIGPRRQ